MAEEGGGDGQSCSYCLPRLSRPSLLRRWYCSTNFFFAREIRVAAACGETPIILQFPDRVPLELHSTQALRQSLREDAPGPYESTRAQQPQEYHHYQKGMQRDH